MIPVDSSRPLKIGLLLVSVFILGVLMTPTAAAQTADITVNASGGGDYTSIQNAVNNATTGDTIAVSDDVYREQVVVDKNMTVA